MRAQRTSLGWIVIGYLSLSASACAAARTSGDAGTGTGSGGDTSSGGSAQATSSGEGGSGSQSSATTTSAGQGGAATTTSGAGGNSSTTSSSTTTSGQGGAGATTSSSASTSSSTGTGGTTLSGGAVVWSRVYGDVDPAQQGVIHDHSVTGIAVDSAGYVYIAGAFSTSMDFGPAGQLQHTPGGTVEAFLAKIAPSGAPLWAKHFGGSNGTKAAANAVDVDAQGNVTIVGNVAGSINFGGATFSSTSNQNIFVASFDSNGNYRYSKGFTGSGSSYPNAMAVNANGDIAFTGLLGGAVTFGGNNLSAQDTSDLFVVKLDAMGNHLMSKRFGGSGLQAGTSVAFSAAGDIVLGGYAAGTIDFGGNPLTATGASCSTAVAKLNGTTGAHLWSKLFDHGTTSDCSRHRVAVDPGDNVLVSVTSNFDQSIQVDFGGGVRTGNFFVLKFSSAGSHLWSRGWGNPRGINDLATDAAGNVLITGLMSKPLDFDTGILTPFDGFDGFIAKLDPQGNGLWARAVSDSNQQSNTQWGEAIAADAAGSVFTTGRLAGAIDLGDGELLAEKGFSSSNDVYLARFTP